MKAIPEGSENMITHVMSDGTKKNSVKGLTVPAGHPVYNVLQRIMMERSMKEEKEHGSATDRHNKTA